MKNKIINTTPPASMYEFFKKLSYKIESAISELIDNSIASFKADSIFFKKKDKNVTVIFDSKNKRIIIRDNAKGIEDNKWRRVLRVMEIDGDNNDEGYNEFGMGLKTAGFWLGNKIRIITKPFDLKIGKKATIDLEKIKKDPNIEIFETNEVFKDSFNLQKHGTIIIIDDINKNLTASNLSSLVNFFAGKYRNDIDEYNINIRLLLVEKNGKIIDLVNMYHTSKKNEIDNISFESTEKLEYKQPKIYKNKNGFIEKEKISFVVEHNYKKYKIKGWVANKAEGQRSDNVGFCLLRRGNAILQNYHPPYLFGSSNSFLTLRMFGELNMGKNIPISQAKDKFDWDDGLEKKIQEAIKNNENFKKIHRLAHIPRRNIKKTHFSSNDLSEHKEEIKNLEKNNGFKSINEAKPELLANELKGNKTDQWFEIETELSKYKICSRLVTNNSSQEWIRTIKYANNLNNKMIVEIDINHPFFNPFNSDKDFLILLRKFSLIIAISIDECKEQGLTIEDFIEKIGLHLSSNLNKGKK